MAIDKKKVLKALKADLQSAESYHEEWQDKRSKWIKEYNGEPYGNERKGKATVVSRDIKKSAAWQHASIIDPFVSSPDLVRCRPTGPSDRMRAKQAEHILNYQFCRDFGRYQFISTSFKVLQREGTVVARVGWEFKEEEQEVDVPDYEMRAIQTVEGYQYQQVPTGTTHKEKQMVTVYNRPTLEVCNNEMVYVDPTCENNIENAQFVVYKYRSNISKLKQLGIYKNLDRLDTTSNEVYSEDYNYNSKDESFKFSDGPRKELEVVEYWGNYDLNDDGVAEPIVCVWINDTIIRLEENPYPGGFLPFVSCAYDSEPFSIYGNANADLIGTDQKIKTGIKRAMLDTLDASTNAQKGIKKQTLDPINMKLFKAGEDFEFNTTAQDIWQGQFNSIPPSVLQFYELVSQDIDGLTGNKAFTGPGANLGSSATAARGILDATAKREIDISRNYKENFLVPILRKWHAMNGEFLDEEQVVRITEEEFVAVSRDDIAGEIDIDIEISTAELDAAKAAELSFLLQTTAQTLPFDMTKIVLADLVRLKQMPDLAKKIEQYQQQPDPVAQKEAMLRIELLKAQVANEQAKAQENQVDVQLKQAKTQNELAKAGKTSSEKDLKDMEFLEKDMGISHQQEMEKKEFDRLRELDVKAFDAMYGNKGKQQA